MVIQNWTGIAWLMRNKCDPATPTTGVRERQYMVQAVEEKYNSTKPDSDVLPIRHHSVLRREQKHQSSDSTSLHRMAKFFGANRRTSKIQPSKGSKVLPRHFCGVPMKTLGREVADHFEEDINPRHCTHCEACTDINLLSFTIVPGIPRNIAITQVNDHTPWQNRT